MQALYCNYWKLLFLIQYYRWVTVTVTVTVLNINLKEKENQLKNFCLISLFLYTPLCLSILQTNKNSVQQFNVMYTALNFIIHANKWTNIYIKIFYKYAYMFQCFRTTSGSLNFVLAKDTNY